MNADFLSFCKKYDIHLNSQQAQAVQAIDENVLLLAVPGSGKTTVLVARLGYMILEKQLIHLHIRFIHSFVLMCIIQRERLMKEEKKQS